MASGELLPVPLHHAEGIHEQDGPASHLAPPPGGDAPELAARVDDDGRAVEPPVFGREQVQRDGGALAGAGRGDGDGGALEGPADERLALRPAPHWPSRMPLRLASRRRKRRPSRLACPWRSDSARRRRSPLLRCLTPASATSSQSMVSSATAGDGNHQQHQPQLRRAPSEPGHDGAQRGRVLQRPDDAGPERGGGDRERRRRRARSGTRGRRPCGRSPCRRANDAPTAEPETGGGRVLRRPVAGGEPRRPAAAGRQHEGADARLEDDRHGVGPPSVTGMHGRPQLPAAAPCPARRCGRRPCARCRPPQCRRCARRRRRRRRRAPRSSRGRPPGSRSISLKDAFISP